MNNFCRRWVMPMLALAFAVFVSSCEKEYSPESDGGGPEVEGGVRLTVGVSGVGDADFVTSAGKVGPLTRSVKSVGDVCSRISFAVYSVDSDGEPQTKLVEVSQASDDKSFGKFSASVPKGKCMLVVIAHSGAEKAGLTYPNKVTFGGKVTDTFYASEIVDVDDDTSLNVCLVRAVAMVRLVVNDKTPADVVKMQFYYTGGSSTFDAVNGCGIVNSKQTEVRTVPASAHEGMSEYDIYTFPRANSQSVDVTVSALDKDGKELFKQKLSGVPVAVNVISSCEGDFFGEATGGGRCAVVVTVDDGWSDTKTFHYGGESSDIEIE